MTTNADSLLTDWLHSLSITEVPPSYQLLGGLSLIGALLRRNVWIDQVEWRVWPNLSVMFVGPTGIGKDVIIRTITRVLDDTGLLIGGKTMEAILQGLIDRSAPPQPTCAVLPLPELTAFLGGKDYQKSAVQELTDLMTTGEKLVLNLRSVQGDRVIHQPTVTVLAGSTMEWLHRAMPEGALEGGFLPRFLIVDEQYPARHIPWVKYSVDTATRRAAVDARKRFLDRLPAVCSITGEITPTPEAIRAYETWYANRFKLYPPSVCGYANRSRDQVLRIAMIHAITCSRNYLQACDVEFGVSVIGRVMQSVERVAAPVSRDSIVADDILAMLPAATPVIFRKLGRRYPRSQITAAIQLLLDSGLIAYRRNQLTPT